LICRPSLIVSSSFFTTFAPQSSHHHFSANAFHAMKWFEWWKLYIIPRGVCVGVWLQCFMEKRCVVWHMVSQKSKGIDKKYKGLIKWMGFRCLGVQGARELAVGCCFGHLASVCVQGGWWGWSGSLPAPPPSLRGRCERPGRSTSWRSCRCRWYGTHRSSSSPR